MSPSNDKKTASPPIFSIEAPYIFQNYKESFNIMLIVRQLQAWYSV